jgi:aspartate carbamoyltransferase regulatory subunit
MAESEIENIRNHHQGTLVDYIEETHSFNIQATLDHSGTLVRANIAISDKGLVKIKDQKMLLLN